MIKKILLVLMLMVCANSADENTKTGEVDHMAIAIAMVYDGKYDAAKSELDLVDINSSELDRAKFYTIKGTLASKTNLHEQAVENFIKAIDETKKLVYFSPKEAQDKKRKYLFKIGSKSKVVQEIKIDPEFERNKEIKIERLYAYISQSYYKLKEYKKSVEALDLSGENGRNKSGLFAFRADCYWKVGEHSNAMEALNYGYKKFSDVQLLKQKYFYLSELKLYKAAVETAKVYIDKAGKKEDDYLYLAQMLIQAKQTEDAIMILEEGKMIFPSNPTFGLMLTNVYLKKEMPHTGATILENTANIDQKYLKDSVEAFRQVKDYSHALYLNLHVVDQKDNIKQKIAMHLERGEFEQITGLKDAMMRNGMHDDENMIYVLAYSYYMVGDYENAEIYLQLINDNDLFQKATIIRKNIEKCKVNPRECV
ncbi:MAG: hypothetical protein M1300_09655 [Epsilonproteobacteria bacterium]|nr:hypothetical protein [Campylobacterota bacterium]